MTDINAIILEITMADVAEHLQQHKLKYLGALGALVAAGGAHKGYKAYKKHQFNKSLKGHLMRNRGTYGGAALGALASLGSTAGTNASALGRLGRMVGSGTVGALAGSIADKHRQNEEWQSKYDHK